MHIICVCPCMYVRAYEGARVYLCMSSRCNTKQVHITNALGNEIFNSGPTQPLKKSMS